MAAFGVTLKPARFATGLIFSTNNSSASVRGPGVCCAMVADWLASCKKLGRSLKTEGEMAGSTTHIVAQSGGELGAHKGDLEIMKSYGLTPPPAQPLNTPVSFANLATLLSTQTGYCWINFFGASGGHSVGASVLGSAYEFLDPNDGLYRFDSAADFIKHVRTNLDKSYGPAGLNLTSSGNLFCFGAL